MIEKLSELTYRPASDELIETLIETVESRFNHEHPKHEDFFCSNLVAYMGERMHLVIARLRDAEAALQRYQNP